MAFFPASVTYPSILGEMYSAAFNAPAFNWICSPACTELETVIMDWVAKALGLPECFLSTSENRGGGVIQGTASESAATMLIAARERRARELTLAEGVKDGSREYEDRICTHRARLVALSSDQAHSSIAKAALVAGTRFRTVSSRLEDNLEMTGESLRATLTKVEEEEGLVPFFITFTMGTTNTCAVDRFAELKAVLNEKESWRRIWVHIDAAYAGAALVVDEYQHIAQNFAEGVDSFNMNMHKWLLVNFDARYVLLFSWLHPCTDYCKTAVCSSETALILQTHSTLPLHTSATPTPKLARLSTTVTGKSHWDDDSEVSRSGLLCAVMALTA